MKIISRLGAATLFFAFGATAHAQSNPISTFQSLLNSTVIANGKGQLTASVLNQTLNKLVPILSAICSSFDVNGNCVLNASVATPNLVSKIGDTMTGALNINAPSQSMTFTPLFFTNNSRALFTQANANWLGNGAGGSATQYGYGGFAQVQSLSGLGDVGIVGATRTEDITTSGRLPIGVMGWGFNFNTTAPQTAWGGYYEARRKKGAGQTHGIEINATDLGDGSDAIVPSAKGSGANAVYSAWSSGLNIAAGGNVRPGGQTGWDGSQNVTQAADAGVAEAIYNNGSKFKKGIIIGDNAVAGCDGTGGANTCSGLEMGRGTGIAWIDGSTRQGSFLNSDVSPSGNGLRQTFTDFGIIFDGYGGATLNVVAKSTDVNGVQILGGGAATAPARVVAAGSPNASLGLSASGSGLVQIQSPLQVPVSTPASATASCLQGQTADDANFHYFCPAPNTWKRSALNTWGAAPTLSAAGTSPSLSTGATDGSGTVTEGTTATGFTLTFGATYTNPRDCVVSSPTGTAFTSYSTSTTALTLVNASGSGAKFTYHCSGS